MRVGEIHVREVAAAAQDVVDEADALEQLGPVDVGDQPHAGDDVAHGDVRGALPLVFLAHQFVGGRSLAPEAVFQPADGRRRLRILVAQALDELDGETLGERHVLVGRQRRRVGRDVVHAQQPVGHQVGLLARGAPAHDALGGATQILDEDDAQGDRHRPQLADGQRLDVLVGAHETRQHLGIEAAVGVGDERPDQPEHARVADQRTVGELRKLAVISRRQIGTDFADLLLDEMVVVEQPLGRRRNGPAVISRLRDVAIGLEQDTLVLPEPDSQRLARGDDGRDRLVGGKAFGVLLQTLDAEQLAANGIFIFPNGNNGRESEDAPQQRFQWIPASSGTTRGQPQGCGTPVRMFLKRADAGHCRLQLKCG